VERVPETAPKGAVFCRLITGTETYAVRNVPVNYAIRFSGPVTALTAHRVWPFARYKDALVPRRFSNISLRPFPPLFSTVLHRPPVVPQATVSSTYSLPAPGLDRTDTTRPVEKKPQHNHRLFFARCLGSIILLTIPPYIGPCLNP
jgi:hypothetical protein